MTDICVIKSPRIDVDYRYIERIGSGSQAQVDLYKSRPPSNTNNLDNSNHLSKIVSLGL